MDEFPQSRMSVGEVGGANEAELNEASWQRWIEKGKAQDAVRRKKFFLVLWLLLPALVVLSLWALLSRN